MDYGSLGINERMSILVSLDCSHFGRKYEFGCQHRVYDAENCHEFRRPSSTWPLILSPFPSHHFSGAVTIVRENEALACSIFFCRSRAVMPVRSVTVVAFAIWSKSS